MLRFKSAATLAAMAMIGLLAACGGTETPNPDDGNVIGQTPTNVVPDPTVTEIDQATCATMQDKTWENNSCIDKPEPIVMTPETCAERHAWVTSFLSDQGEAMGPKGWMTELSSAPITIGTSANGEFCTLVNDGTFQGVPIVEQGQTPPNSVHALKMSNDRFIFVSERTGNRAYDAVSVDDG